jgi:transposase InsO family protein
MVKIMSNNGSEFCNTRVEEYCDGEGIKHEFSSTYTPQQNGVVERKNKTLITLARAMLDDYGVSQRFWVEAINTTCHASNRVYLQRLMMKTPYELLVGRKSNISYFRVFGCKCFILLTVYFGTPSMFITLWFGFDYGTNPPLGTLII